MFGQLKFLPGSSLQTLPFHFYEKKSNKNNFTPKILPPERGEKYFDSKNSCRDRLRSLLNNFHEKNRIKNSTPKFQPPKRGEKCYVSKNSYRDRLCSPFVASLQCRTRRWLACAPSAKAWFRLSPRVLGARVSP